MLQTVEAIVEKNGAVRLLEPVHPAQVMRALVTLVEPAEEPPPQTLTPLHVYAGKLKHSSVFSGSPVQIQQHKLMA